ncbi:MAG: response regulator transcription factor [Cyclobacteriaceae bacterium]|nr:response regulator transcription factor [Cyclobacteriaceae bacterium]
MSSIIRIGLVEDQHLFREGIKSILSSYTDLEVVMESANGYSVLEKLQQLESIGKIPHVLLVDLTLPPINGKAFNGLDVTTAVTTQFPDLRVVILSAHDDQRFIAELIEHGAHGYLVKDSDPKEVYDAICAVFEKGLYINERTLKAIQQNLANKNRKTLKIDNIQHDLTKREIEVLQLVCQQMTAEEVADRLFISVKTVNGHKNNLLQKTNSRNTAGLVLYAIKYKIVDLI